MYMENPYLSIIVTYITYQMNLGVETGKKVLLAVQIKSPTDILKEIKIYM